MAVVNSFQFSSTSATATPSTEPTAGAQTVPAKLQVVDSALAAAPDDGGLQASGVAIRWTQVRIHVFPEYVDSSPSFIEPDRLELTLVNAGVDVHLEIASTVVLPQDPDGRPSLLHVPGLSGAPDAQLACHGFIGTT